MVMQKTLIKQMFGFLIVCLGTANLFAGSVRMSYWEASPSTILDDAIVVTKRAAPTAAQTLSTMDFPGFIPDKNEYVAKYTGWIVPPVTGDYTFYIASDNDSGFWLSSDSGDPNIVDAVTTPPQCRVTGTVPYLDFVVRLEQQSSPVFLQAGQPYAFTIIHRNGIGEDHAALGWKIPGEENVKTIDAWYFANGKKAGNLSPSEGAVNIVTGLLSWISPAVSSGNGTLTYDVYLDKDPNLFASSLKASGLTSTTFDAGAVDGVNLEFDTTYYWRVDVHDPNGQGVPMIITGDAWSFMTNDGAPFIVNPPDHVFGELNQGAVFTVAADTLRSEQLSYQWSFKTFAGSVWTDIPQATEASLILADLQPEDRGMYRVIVSDSLGNFVQAEANLYLRVGLVNRYSFTNNVEDSVGGMHGTLVIQNATSFPAVYEDAAGTTGDQTKKQLYLQNGPSTPSSGGGNCCYVQLPSSFVSSIGKQMTVMVWFTWRATSDQNWQGVLNFNDGTSNNYLTLTPRSDSRTPRFAYRTQAEQRFLFSPIPLVRQTTEYCVAITWNEETGLTEMYVNGNRVSSNDIHFKLSEDLNDINNWLGRQVANADPAFWGAYNEFRVYDVALGEPTISEAYQLGPDVLPGNPCVIQPAMDLDDDCEVNLDDFTLLASEWLACGLTTCN